MGWHYGTVGCQPVANEIDGEPPELSTTVGYDAVGQEREATRFAGYLILPETFLRPLIRSTNMDAILDGLNSAGVSADAAFMRLRNLLQPGFLFKFKVGDERRTYASPGTVTPAGCGQLGERALRDSSAEWGVANVSDRRVEWFRLTDFEPFVPVPGSPSATVLLRSAIASCELDAARRQRMLLSINGVVGGSLSVERAHTPQQALALLRHKFDSKSEYEEVAAHPSFDLYLRRKVEEWAHKRGLL
ncbi:hypothetical protein GCM10027605_66060 [Micromonospora zhanjiangensis]